MTRFHHGHGLLIGIDGMRKPVFQPNCKSTARSGEAAQYAGISPNITISGKRAKTELNKKGPGKGARAVDWIPPKPILCYSIKFKIAA
ncbi:MAG: hypothetical protein ONB44_01795 [candidate division KSB1 bacterium]|nr:hypothetical protein [candidate division KSB1 bacterium]